MRIKSVTVRNFRSIKEETLTLDEITSLIGRNGAGKSNFLMALKMFYEPASVNENDFYNRVCKCPAEDGEYGEEQDVEISVRITFTDLTEDEKNSDDLKYYVSQDEFIIERVFKLGERPFLYGYKWGNPDFAPCKAIEKSEPKIEEYCRLRGHPEYSDLPEKPDKGKVTIAFIDNSLKEWEDKHLELLQMIRDDGKFWGWANVGDGRLGKYTDCIFIPAVKEATDELSDAGKAAMGQLLKIRINQALEKRPERETLIKNIREHYGAYYQFVEKVKEESRIEEELTRMLQDYAYNAGFKIMWSHDLESIEPPLPKAEALLLEDEYEGPVDKVGHGLQRIAILVLLQSLRTSEKSSTSEPSEEQAESNNKVGIQPHLLIVMEEPELYQHPNRQRVLARKLREIASSSVEGFGVTQIIFSTHSPAFIDLQNFNAIRLIRKDSTCFPGVSVVSSHKINHGLPGEQHDLIEIAASRVELNRQEFLVGLDSISSLETNEGFFADLVVLVEGDSDRAALMATAHAQGRDLESMNIAVVSCDGANNLGRFWAIFETVGIPTFVVWDNDKTKHDKKIKEAQETASSKKKKDLLGAAQSIIDRNKKLYKLFTETETPDDFPVVTNHIKVACLAGNLETVMKNELNHYDEELERVSREFGINKKHAVKKPMVVTEIIKRCGTPPPTIGSIVDRIVSLL